MLLAVDTSTAQVGLALYDGTQGQVVGEFTWRSSQRHTVELAPAVSEMLTRCGLAMEQVQALGVALGPGSFTSLRVGLAFVKGLAISRGLPLVGISTLDIVAAAQAASDLPLIVVIQAGRGRLAVGAYKHSGEGWQAEGPARVVTLNAWIDELDDRAIVCGELASREREALRNRQVRVASPAQSLRRPAVLAELAWARWQAGAVDHPATLAPIYLQVAGSIPA